MGMYCKIQDMNLDNIGAWPPFVRILSWLLYAFLIGRVGYSLWFQGLSQRIDKIHGEQQHLMQKLNTDSPKITSLQILQNKIQALKKEKEAFLVNFPHQNQISNVLEKISQTSQLSQLVLKSLQPQAEHISNHYSELPLHINMLGQFSQLYFFLENLSGQIPGFSVHNFDLTLAPPIDNSETSLFNMNLDSLMVLNTAIMAPSINALAENRSRKFLSSKKTLSLEFQNISVASLLQQIAKVAGLSLMISDAVHGTITLQLQEVDWHQALDMVLKMRGLAMSQEGNMLFISSTEEMTQREQQAFKLQQQSFENAPLQSQFIQIHYGKAVEIASLVKDKANNLLSTRGTVNADPRTNSLWLQDIPEKIGQVQRLVKQWDIPMQQVLIEARVVNVDDQKEKDLGVKFGVLQPNHIGGSLEGVNEMAKGLSPADIPVKDRLNFDLGATPSGGKAAVFGIALMKLADSALLDLELSALESTGEGEIISSPRLITANQQTADIQAGEEIPYQESTSSGATNVSFKKAVLSLHVTPQITPDHKILLKLKINQDKASVKLVNNVPAIDTREIDTEVLVDNGQTLILGGIYEHVNDKQVKKVPLLGDLPLLGSLFRKNQERHHRRELLIFVTPKIL